MSLDHQTMRVLLAEAAAQVRREADGATWFELASATARAHRDLAGRGRGAADEALRAVAQERYRLLSELLAVETQRACSKALQRT